MNGGSSILDPAGPAARTLSELGWPLLVGFTGVAALMWGLIVWLAVRRPGRLDWHAAVGDGTSDHAGMRWIAVGGFIIPGVVFTGAFVATTGVLRAMPTTHAESTDVAEIHVIGHQWWWEVEYRPDADSTRWFKTANELHLPAGRPVDIDLDTADVIHSFWVPRLHGKVDLVPGQTNRIRLQADRTGVLTGACAEFCGLQHAKMRFVVVVDAPAEYQRWLDWQRQPASVPRDAKAQLGQAVFMTAACPLCHTIGGTSARATIGPDLTHLGSRLTLGAGTLPLNVATLHAWVLNAPSLKPGTRMPVLSQFSGPNLHALVAYLEVLQ
jgi:cytochrome c oxidase subunit II